MNSHVNIGLTATKSQIFNKSGDYYQFEDTLNNQNENESDNFVVNKYSRPNKLTHYWKSKYAKDHNIQLWDVCGK